MSSPSTHVQSLSDTVLTSTASTSMNTSSSETKVGDETVVDEERILSQAGDAETESEDDVDVDEEHLDLHHTSSYYHGSIKTSEAEKRLKSHGEDNCYLFRESAIKKRIFVLSFLSNGQLTHFQVPNSEGKNILQNYQEAAKVVEDMIHSSSSCQHPVPGYFQISSKLQVVVNHSYKDLNDEMNVKIDHKLREEEENLTCWLCDLTMDNKKNFHAHALKHKVKKCFECGQFIPVNSSQFHQRNCNTVPEQVKCDLCDFKTIHVASMLRHKKCHTSKPHLCGQCGKCFNSVEKLKHHDDIHKGGYPCEHCDQRFSRRQNMNTHVKRIHRIPDGDIQKKKGRTTYRCQTEGCKFVTRDKKAMPRHVNHKHRSKPRRSFQCSVCEKEFVQKFNYLRHISNCGGWLVVTH